MASSSKSRLGRKSFAPKLPTTEWVFKCTYTYPSYWFQGNHELFEALKDSNQQKNFHTPFELGTFHLNKNYDLPGNKERINFFHVTAQLENINKANFFFLLGWLGFSSSESLTALQSLEITKYENIEICCFLRKSFRMQMKASFCFEVFSFSLSFSQTSSQNQLIFISFWYQGGKGGKGGSFLWNCGAAWVGEYNTVNLVLLTKLIT